MSTSQANGGGTSGAHSNVAHLGRETERPDVLHEYTHTMMHPLVLRNAEGGVIDSITSLTLKRPLGKEMAALDHGKGEMSKTMSLIAACARVPRSHVDLMDGEDIIALAEVLERFLPSLKTGGK